MTTRNKIFNLLMMLCMLSFTACSGGDSDETEVVEDTVQNPTKIQHYDGSTQFVGDLEALIDYSCAVYAMRMAYYNIVSNDFKTGQAYVATPADINANTTSMYDFYDIAATIVDKGDQYEAAFQRLEDEGALENTNASRQTRGWLSDTFSFVFGLKKSQEVGRKSVLAVIQQSGWQNDDNNLQKLFNAVDPKRRQGYSNARQFWADFSQGKLDAKSNQIFQDLYHDANTDFGTNAQDLGFSPTGNMTKTAAMLIEKGLSVVIDAAPGGLAGSMTMGKDLYNTYEATEDVVKHTVKGTLTQEEAQRLITQWASNLINYNDKILNNIDGGKWDATIDMWDTPGNFLGQEFANMMLNDMNNLSEDVFRMSFGTLLDEQAITVKDKDGNPIDVVIVQDEDGKVRVSAKRSNDGSHKVKADKKKKKKVTAADKKGHRKTKDVKAGEDEVEVELTKEENDEPKDGYIDYSPKSFEFPAEGGSQRIKLTTNYLYYGVTTSVDDGYWLEASPVPLSDEFVITAKPNNSGEDRTGKVIVKATNKKGKVLKWITLTAFQKAAGNGVVKITPSVMPFGPEGGTETATISCEGFQYYGGYLDDDAEGWVTLSVNDNLTFTITVKANDTGVERTGKVVAFATNAEQPTNNDIITATLLIKQDAAGAFTGEWFDVLPYDGLDAPIPDSDNFFTHGFKFYSNGTYEWCEYQCKRNGNSNRVTLKDGNRRKIKGRYSISGNTLRLTQDSGEYSYSWNTSKEFTADITTVKNPFEDVYKLPFTGQKMVLTSKSGEKLTSHIFYQGVWDFEYKEEEVPQIDHITIRLRANTKVAVNNSSSDGPKEYTEKNSFTLGEMEEEANFTQSKNGNGLHVVCTTDKDYVNKGEGSIPDYHISEHLNISLDLDDISNGISGTKISSVSASWSREDYEVNEPETGGKQTFDIRAANIPYGLGGTKADGTSISHFSTYQLTTALLADGRIRKNERTYTLIDDDEWYIDVSLSTKTQGSSSRRQRIETRTISIPLPTTNRQMGIPSKLTVLPVHH